MINVTDAVAADCLGCLCEASTSCNSTIGCTSAPPGGYFCGPFLISRAYWVDAGKPVLGGDDPERAGGELVPKRSGTQGFGETGGDS